MYLVTGSNLFGQWMSDDYVYETFMSIPEDNKKIQICDQSELSVQHISWAYNIFLINEQMYLSGSFKGLVNKFIPVKLPDECKSSELLISGNDYNLILVGKNNKTVWLLNLEKENELKKINLNIETPLENQENTNTMLENTKKMRMDNEIVKAVMMDDMCLYLTSSGTVYSGLLPSYVDTRHCFGKVCDIQCGYEHCVLLTNAGRVYTWGNGRRLQLGHGDVSNQDLPTELEALAGIRIVKIKTGGWHTLALSEFGDLYAWGWNDTGQLGIRADDTGESGKSQGVPTLVDIYDGNSIVEKNVKDIACGSKHSMILLEDNSIWTTGCNKYAQLGFSPDKYDKINNFKETYHNMEITEIMCGPWCSVIKYT